LIFLIAMIANYIIFNCSFYKSLKKIVQGNWRIFNSFYRQIWEGIDCIFYQKDGIERQASFVANWDVYFNEIADNYTTEDISLEDLFRLWAEKVIKEYPNGLIPIT
jgi:hypothetical protein